MIKDLQKQIGAKKQELIQPSKEKFEAIFKGHNIFVDFNIDGTAASLSTNSVEDGNVLVLNFVLSPQGKEFSNYSFKQEFDGELVVATRAVPFTIDFEVIGFVFYELSQILESLKPEETETQVSDPETKDE